jgi:hypothetical protein
MEQTGRYEGWTNYATFDAALMIDNSQTKHQLAISHALKESDLETLVIRFKLQFGGPHDTVNWSEIAEHYLIKVREGVRP